MCSLLSEALIWNNHQLLIICSRTCSLVEPYEKRGCATAACWRSPGFYQEMRINTSGVFFGSCFAIKWDIIVQLISEISSNYTADKRFAGWVCPLRPLTLVNHTLASSLSGKTARSFLPRGRCVCALYTINPVGHKTRDPSTTDLLGGDGTFCPHPPPPPPWHPRPLFVSLLSCCGQTFNSGAANGHWRPTSVLPQQGWKHWFSLGFWPPLIGRANVMWPFQKTRAMMILTRMQKQFLQVPSGWNSWRTFLKRA